MSHEATAWAFKQTGLRPSAKLVLLTLADCHNPAGGCFPTQAFIADRCEMNRDTVNVQLSILEDRGLIRRIRTIDPKSKRQRPTRYKLGCEADFHADRDDTSAGAEAKNPVSEKSTRAAKAVSENPAEPCRNSRQSRVGNSDSNLVREPVMNLCANAGHIPQSGDCFEYFWNVHPRPRDRARSKELFEAAVTTGVSPDRITRAAQRYRAENASNLRQYVAYSDNWLKANRWEDYPDTPDVAAPNGDLGNMAVFWAANIKAGRYIPQNGIGAEVAHIMLANGLVTEDQLRKAGVRS